MRQKLPHTRYELYYETCENSPSFKQCLATLITRVFQLVVLTFKVVHFHKGNNHYTVNTVVESMLKCCNLKKISKHS